MSALQRLPNPDPGQYSAERYVAQFLSHLVCDEIAASPAFRGGHSSAQRALEDFSVQGFGSRRKEVYPARVRGAASLSPWIGHGLLHVNDLWVRSRNANSADRSAFLNEILWRSYAQHWYARLGSTTEKGMKKELPTAQQHVDLDRSMGCMELSTEELEEDGWIPRQVKSWLASHWSVRNGQRWSSGEEYFYKHLLDGSRAVDRLDWQLATGIGAGRPYKFSRWDVEEQAPGLCASCDLAAQCPIEYWPDEPQYVASDLDPLVISDANFREKVGPSEAQVSDEAQVIWITPASLGNSDPAMCAHPDLPVAFVFDEALLSRQMVSSKRLIFWIETLAELAIQRNIEIWLGDPLKVFEQKKLAATFTPLPGWKKRAKALNIVAEYPWPWFLSPNGESLLSFEQWRNSMDAQIKKLLVDAESVSVMSNSEVR